LIVGIGFLCGQTRPKIQTFALAFTRGSSSTRKTKSRHRQSAAEALFHLERPRGGNAPRASLSILTTAVSDSV
jgi:hypothetical protein